MNILSGGFLPLLKMEIHDIFLTLYAPYCREAIKLQDQ